MATWKIIAPRVLGQVSTGESFIIVSRTTANGPDATDIEEVLYANGYKDASTLSYRASGNWTCEKINDDTSGWNQQHKNYEDAVNKDKEKKQENNNSSSSSHSSSSSNDDNNDEEGSCVKFIFTIIPILPVWWVIKLVMKCGMSIFVILWWSIKAVFYIVSWPVRILLYCCLDKEERSFLPKWNFNILPAYSFKKF